MFLRTGTYAALLCSVDTGDTAAQAELEKLMTKRAALVGGIVALRKYLQGLGEGLDALTQSDELKPYAFFLKENQQQAAHMLGDEVEQALSLLEITGSQAWSQLHSTLTSTVSVDYALGDDQRTMTLPMVRNLASDPDPAVRRARGLARDGAAYEPWWETWAAAERAHFARNRTRERADLVVAT